MRSVAILYSTKELAWIERGKRKPRRQLHAEFCKRFKRSDVSKSNLTALCKRKGWLTGRDGKFTAGQKSWNTGRKIGSHPNSKATQFKKGQTPHNTKKLWSERVTLDGYVEISIPKPNKHTGFWRSYVLKHRWLWEQKHGPVPKGYALKCLDGDRTNTDPSNWEAIPRALLPRLNARWGGVKYDAADGTLKPAVMAIAKLEHAAREKRKTK